MTTEVVIVEAVRSAVGRAIKGSLAYKRPDELAGDVITGLMKRVPQIKPELVEDLIVGCAMPEGEQGLNIARMCGLLGGLPEESSAQHSEGVVAGYVSVPPAAEVDITFIGLFNTWVPEGRPVRCAIQRGSGRFILDKEHGFAAPGRRGLRGGGPGRGALLGARRQDQLEERAFAGRVFHLDVASALLDDAVDRG